MKKFAVVLALVSLGLLPALAQSPVTGLPPFSSFQSAGFDTVNLQNLNANFSIPIVSVAGRGTNFNFSIVFDSLLWQKVGTSWTPVVDASGNPTWGWKKDTPSGEVGFKVSTLRVHCGDGTWNYNTTWSSYFYRDIFGTVHGFTLAIYDAGCTGIQSSTGSPNSTDGSGFYLSVSVTDPDHPVVISPGGLQTPTGGSVTDTNGNLISKIVVNSSENDWKDTVGHTVMKVITGTNSIQYQFQDSTGTYQTATLNLSPYTIKTFFQCGVGEYTGTSTVNLPVSLVLPNNKQYTFTYEQTPGSGSGFTTGRVQRVTLPTGGYYEFDYTGLTGNDSVNCADGTTTNLTRIVNDGASTATA
jgi:hypothetical protein